MLPSWKHFGQERLLPPVCSLAFQDKAELEDTIAFQDLLEELSRPTSRAAHGDRLAMRRRSVLHEKDITGVYAGFKSLFQGDHLGVEYALSAHQAMLRDGGVLLEDQ